MTGMGWMSARAQQVETAPQYAPLEISFNYSYARANAAPGECGCFNMNGGNSEVASHAFRHLSVVADLTSERATNSVRAPAMICRWSSLPSGRASATVLPAEDSLPLCRGLSASLTASTGCSPGPAVRLLARPPHGRFWLGEGST
jgi:hypothetical protein